MTKTEAKTTRILAVILTCIMALTMTQTTAFAEEPENPEEPPAGAELTTTVEETGPEDPTGPTDPEEPTGSEEPTQTTEDPTPAAPAVKVKRSGSGLMATWSLVPGADYYEVYRSYSSKSKGKRLGKVTGKLSYTDKKVASGKKAYYRVRAHYENGFTAYSGAASNTIYRVYIETGHGIDRNGNWDPGCTWGKYQEAKLMLPICKSMAKYLRAKGVYVYTDADKGNNTNLRWLLKNLKSYNVSVLVNVHCDYRKAPRGTLPLYRYSEQKKLAKCLNAGVHKNVKIKDRGLKKRKNLASLNQTKDYCVACLFETGNIKKDNKILRKKYDAYGKGLAMGVCSYLGVKW